MNSRESILNAVRKNQPEASPLPDISGIGHSGDHSLELFISKVEGAGGKAIPVRGYEDIIKMVATEFEHLTRTVTTIPALSSIAEVKMGTEAHQLADVDLAILPGQFGVAENGAVWVTEELMHERVLPFICQNLALVINKADILPTLHEAYDRISNMEYGFAAFIAGPSKTADIEQSLVLGAHGPKNMLVFILSNE